MGDFISSSVLVATGAGAAAAGTAGRREIGQHRSLFERRTGNGPIDGPLKPDLEVLFLQLKLRNGVFPHQINDGFDFF
jgi:hypothetical protein